MQKATNIHFSIVKHVENEHHLVGSFYLQLLGLQGKSYKPSGTNKMDEQYDAQQALPVNLKLPSRGNHHILDQTYAHCQRRFIASYLLQARPAFTSDFHLRFLYQGLINHYEAVYRAQLDKKGLSLSEQKRIRSVVDNLFPQWTKTRKDLYYRDKKRFVLTQEKVGGNAYYTMPRPLSLFGLKKLETIPTENTYVPENKQMRARKCMYCPFKLSCRESLEVVEDNE